MRINDISMGTQTDLLLLSGKADKTVMYTLISHNVYEMKDFIYLRCWQGLDPDQGVGRAPFVLYINMISNTR